MSAVFKNSALSLAAFSALAPAMSSVASTSPVRAARPHNARDGRGSDDQAPLKKPYLFPCAARVCSSSARQEAHGGVRTAVVEVEQRQGIPDLLVAEFLRAREVVTHVRRLPTAV